MSPNPIDPRFFAVDSNPFFAVSRAEMRAETTAAAPDDGVWTHDARDDEEDDVPGSDAVDIRVLWGMNVLHFTQLCPPRAFTLGGVGSDYPLPELDANTETATRPLVITKDDGVYVFVPSGGTADVNPARGNVLSLQQCIEKGTATPSIAASGGYEVRLVPGARVKMRAPGSELVYEIARFRARRAPTAGFWAGADVSTQLYTGLSALLHVTVIGSLAFFLPSMRSDDAEAVDRDSAAAMRPYLDALADKEPEHRDEVSEIEASASHGRGGGSQAAGPSGTMGNRVSTSHQAARYAIAGDEADAKLARARAVAEATTLGFIGFLNSSASGSMNTPVAPWGQELAAGHDAQSALGAMWAPSIGEAFGADGLGLSGVGDGGGGQAHGVGIYGVGSTVAHGSGDWPGDGPGRGPGDGLGPSGTSHGLRGMPGHATRPPILREVEFSANGTLPREVIQRVVRMNFGRFRLCYEGGLRTNPGLSGRVAVNFVIDRTGAVAVSAADRSSDMPDADVVACVVRGFLNLSFPAPENGLVKVTYPLLLAPGQ